MLGNIPVHNLLQNVPPPLRPIPSETVKASMQAQNNVDHEPQELRQARALFTEMEIDCINKMLSDHASITTNVELHYALAPTKDYHY